MDEFFDSYEQTDPEPPLRYDDGIVGVHYFWPDVVAHMEWHRKATDFYLRNVAGKYHRDEVTA